MKAAFGYDLLNAFRAKEGEKVELFPGEIEYYQKYIFLRDFGIKPYELDLISVEDLNALWELRKYDMRATVERAEEEAKNKQE